MKLRMFTAVALLIAVLMATNVMSVYACDCCPCPCTLYGFTPGYWSGGQNHKGIGYDNWPGDQALYKNWPLVTIFPDYKGGATHLSALSAADNIMSTGQDKLARQGMAAYLNARYFYINGWIDWNYVNGLIYYINNAFASGDDAYMTQVAAQLDYYNNYGFPVPAPW